MVELSKTRLCQLFEIESITGSKKQTYVYARMIFCKYFTDMGMTQEECGRHIGLKHPAVYNMKTKFQEEYERNRYFRMKADQFYGVPLFDFVEKETNQLF